MRQMPVPTVASRILPRGTPRGPIRAVGGYRDGSPGVDVRVTPVVRVDDAVAEVHTVDLIEAIIIRNLTCVARGRIPTRLSRRDRKRVDNGVDIVAAAIVNPQVEHSLRGKHRHTGTANSAGISPPVSSAAR